MWKVALVFFTLLVLAILYVLFVRPVLEHFNLVKPLPANVESMLERIAWQVRNSATMFWNWLLGLLGTAIAALTGLVPGLDTPEIKQTVAELAPKYLGYFVLGIAVIGGLARLRSLIGKD